MATYRQLHTTDHLCLKWLCHETILIEIYRYVSGSTYNQPSKLLSKNKYDFMKVNRSFCGKRRKCFMSNCSSIQQCFQKSSVANALKCVCLWEMVHYMKHSIPHGLREAKIDIRKIFILADCT